MPATDLYDYGRPEAWQRPRRAEQRPKLPPWLALGLVAGGVALAAVVGLGLGLGRTTQAPACADAKSEINRVEEFLRRDRPDTAADTIDLLLEKPDQRWCPQVGATLADLGYTATMNQLLSPPAGLSAAAAEGSIGPGTTQRWREVERKADSNGVPPAGRLPARTVSDRAFNAGKWGLARAAFLQAWNDGGVSARDMGAIAHYYAILRNGGLTESARGTPESRQLALMWLATSCRISRAYALPQTESCRDLVVLAGADEEAWPAPLADDPVLTAAPSGR